MKSNRSPTNQQIYQTQTPQAINVNKIMLKAYWKYSTVSSVSMTLESGIQIPYENDKVRIEPA